MTTVLFFDDWLLNRRDNVVRRIGRPALIQESVYRDPHVNTHWGYPMVFKDEASGKWRMNYQGWNLDGPKAPLLAESDDGLRWAPRDTSREIDLPDRQFPHQLLPLDRFGEWSACYVDPHAVPDERIKGFVVHRGKKTTAKPWGDSYLWVSPDGLHWTLKEGVEWQREAPDPGVGAFWNAIRNSYVITTRPDAGDRRIAVFETRDWNTFTRPELALQADALDSPLTEPYCMPVFPYEGYFIGLLWLYHTAPQVEGHSPHKFYDGHVDCQLAYSMNGWHFQRGLRDPFIPNGEPGDPDAGCVYPSCLLQKDDGSLWIYASACTREHGYIPPGSGTLVAYRLRRDGFVYLESSGGTGTVGTRALRWGGEEVSLNVQGQGGEVRAQATDAAGVPLKGYTFQNCDPFSGDQTDWVPAWKDGMKLQAQSGKVIRIEVQLQSSRLYAIRGDFVPLIGAQVGRFTNLGVLPESGRDL
jgi:hypothetical protein